MAEKFKPFWVKSVNNWLCDAGYNGKELKAKSPVPSFRKYYFIRSWEDLNGFTKRDGYTNKELCEWWLGIIPELPKANNILSPSNIDKQ